MQGGGLRQQGAWTRCENFLGRKIKLSEMKVEVPFLAAELKIPEESLASKNSGECLSQR